MTIIRMGLLGGVALVAACAVGPDYQPPATPPAAVLNNDAKSFTAAKPTAEWWSAFEDPVLDDLVHRAVAGNLDLKVAVARVREARALFADAKLDRYPRVTTEAAYQRSDEQFPGFGTRRINIESADIGFDASWEVDLFGHVRRGIEAASADTGAAEADARDAQVTVTAEVARNYFELRGAQQRRVVAIYKALGGEWT
jgi:multidrug efflux system outer membrane protein